MWIKNYWIKINPPIEIFKTTKNSCKFKNRSWAWCFYFHHPIEFCIAVNKPKIWLEIEKER